MSAFVYMSLEINERFILFEPELKISHPGFDDLYLLLPSHLFKDIELFISLVAIFVKGEYRALFLVS